jgi:hypothetical protein
VESVDPAAVRFTPDVVIAIKHQSIGAADAAMRAAGFHRVFPDQLDHFLEEPCDDECRRHLFIRKAVRFVADSPDAEFVEFAGVRVLALDALVREELNSGRTLGKVLVRDLIDVGLVNESWCDRLPPALADRLRELLADPDG